LFFSIQRRLKFGMEIKLKECCFFSLGLKSHWDSAAQTALECYFFFFTPQHSVFFFALTAEQNVNI